MDPVPGSIVNEEPLVEQLNDEFTKKVLPVTIFVGLEVVLGFFGNLVVLYVFLFRYHVCNFRYFVLCLAFIDITSTLTTMPGEMVTHLYWYIYPAAELCKVKSFFNMFTVSSEALCLLTIAVDRYRKVCQPLGWQIKPKGALVVIILIYITSLILAMPVPFLWGISFHQEVYKGVNITTTICEKDGKYKHTKRPLQYSITMESIVSICLIAMFVMYVQVARTLLKKKRRKRWSAKVDAMVPSSSMKDSTSNADAIKELPDHSDTAYISSIENSHRKQSCQSDRLSSEEQYVTTYKPSDQLSSDEQYVTTFKPSDQLSSDEQYITTYKPSDRLSSDEQSQGHQVTTVTFKSNNEQLYFVGKDVSTFKQNKLRFSEENRVATFKPSLQHGHNNLMPLQTRSQMVSADYETPTDESRGITTDEDDVKTHRRTHRRPKSGAKRVSRNIRTKVRRKTLIMLVLTITFMITTVLYLTLLSFIARADDVLHKMSHTWKAVYFLAFRLYFINHVINPIVYGLLDPHFRKGLQKRK